MASSNGQHALHIRWYKNWRILVLLGLLLIFLSMYLPTGLYIAYNYYWWIFRSSGVFTWAVPEQAGRSQEPIVPKLLHQTWKNTELPEQWKHAQKTCMDMHPDYQYKLWTDEDAEQMIKHKFPWFMDTWKAYPYGIQRADALRYFVLYEYGGIYIDLDVVCHKNLDYLRRFDFVAPKTYPVGVSNDIMVAKQNSDFALHLLKSLAPWNIFLFVKYATVMFSTGPMFVTMQYALYACKDQLAVLPVDLYGKYKLTPAALFEHLHGSSWHGSDGKYILWIDRHHVLFFSLLLLLLVSAVTGLYVSYRHHSRHGAGPVYSLTASNPVAAGAALLSGLLLSALGGQAGHTSGPMSRTTGRKMTPP